MKFTILLVLACTTYVFGQSGEQCSNGVNRMMGCMEDGIQDRDLKRRCDNINDDMVNKCFTSNGCTEPTMEAMLKKKLANSPFGGMTSGLLANMQPNIDLMKECVKEGMPHVHSCMKGEVDWMNDITKQPSAEEMGEKMDHIKKIMKSKMIGKACDKDSDKMDQVRSCLERNGAQTDVIGLRQDVCEIAQTCKNSNGELGTRCKNDVKRAGCECGKQFMPEMITCAQMPDSALKMMTCVANKKNCNNVNDDDPMSKMSPEKMMERICSDSEVDDEEGGFMSMGGSGNGPPPEVMECVQEMNPFLAAIMQNRGSGGGNQGGNRGGGLFGSFGSGDQGPSSMISRLFGQQSAPQASNIKSNGPQDFFSRFFNRGAN